MRVMPVLGVVMILVSQAASQSVTNTQASATQEHSFAFISSQDFKAIMGGVICFWGGVWALGGIFMVVLMAKNYCTSSQAAGEEE